MGTKKIVFSFFLFIVLSTTLTAQSFSPISRGTYTVGGNIGYSNISETDDDDNTVYFSLTPEVGYFFIDNFYTSLRLTYRYLSSGDYSSNTYGIGPTLRYYFNINKLKPFLGLGYSYSITKEGGNSDDEFQFNEFSMSVGADYFITNYFALEGKIDYTISKMEYTYSDNDKSNKRDITTLYIGIGANYFIH